MAAAEPWSGFSWGGGSLCVRYYRAAGSSGKRFVGFDSPHCRQGPAREERARVVREVFAGFGVRAPLHRPKRLAPTATPAPSRRNHTRRRRKEPPPEPNPEGGHVELIGCERTALEEKSSNDGDDPFYRRKCRRSPPPASSNALPNPLQEVDKARQEQEGLLRELRTKSEADRAAHAEEIERLKVRGCAGGRGGVSAFL